MGGSVIATSRTSAAAAQARRTVVNLGNRLDARVLGAGVVGVGVLLLVPVEDAADKGRDEGDAGLGARDGLLEAEQEGEVAVDALLLEVTGGLDTLPGRGDLDQDALLGDADLLVESDELLGLWEDKHVESSGNCCSGGCSARGCAHLGLGRLLVERESGVNLGRDAAGNDVEDLLAELDEL